MKKQRLRGCTPNCKMCKEYGRYDVYKTTGYMLLIVYLLIAFGLFAYLKIYA